MARLLNCGASDKPIVESINRNKAYPQHHRGRGLRARCALDEEGAQDWKEILDKWHRVVRTMRGDEVVARKCSAPIALAARDEDGLALLVGEQIERLLVG